MEANCGFCLENNANRQGEEMIRMSRVEIDAGEARDIHKILPHLRDSSLDLETYQRDETRNGVQDWSIEILKPWLVRLHRRLLG